jgi:hypothetical protein
MTQLPDNPERDPALADAWREHSNEMPPAPLDAAILAAAHRAVGSVPQDSGKQARESTSPQRWWMPLAAAATIGAIALGILQTVPQDQPVTATSSSDMPSVASSVTSSVASSAAQDSLKAVERKDAPRAAAAPAMAQAKPAAKLVIRQVEESAAPPPASFAAAPQPFPADKKGEMADAVTATDRPGAAPARMMVERDLSRQRNEVTAQSAPAASGAVALGKTTSSAESGFAKAIDVDGWIVRIRKLHDDGKLADAAKELVALRAAVPDADHRLPPELRAWAATVKP